MASTHFQLDGSDAVAVQKSKTNQSKQSIVAQEKISNKKFSSAILLCFFLGSFGAHRFYTGKNISGIIMLLTFGGFGFWTMIDFFMIVFGLFKDKKGLKLAKSRSQLNPSCDECGNQLNTSTEKCADCGKENKSPTVKIIIISVLGFIYFCLFSALIGSTDSQYQMSETQTEVGGSSKGAQSIEISKSQNEGTPFSFAEIKWDDNIKTIKKKLKKTGLLEKKEGNYFDPHTAGFIVLDNHEMRDSFASTLRDEYYSAVNQYPSKAWSVETIRPYFSSNDSPILDGRFHYSTSIGKLLHYTLTVKKPQAEAVINNINEKYKNHYKGKTGEYHLWEKDGLEAIYFDTQGNVWGYPVIYVSAENYREYVNYGVQIGLEREENRNKNSKKVF